jgi:hypothetical protein
MLLKCHLSCHAGVTAYSFAVVRAEVGISQRATTLCSPQQARAIKFLSAMHCGSIIPNHQITAPPLVRKLKLWFRTEVEKHLKNAVALLLWDALDV